MSKKANIDNRANQLNKNNPAYHKARGVEPPRTDSAKPQTAVPAPAPVKKG